MKRRGEIKTGGRKQISETEAGKRSGKRKVRIEEKDKVKEERGVGRGRYLSGRGKGRRTVCFLRKVILSVKGIIKEKSEKQSVKSILKMSVLCIKKNEFVIYFFSEVFYTVGKDGV